MSITELLKKGTVSLVNGKPPYTVAISRTMDIGLFQSTCSLCDGEKRVANPMTGEYTRCLACRGTGMNITVMKPTIQVLDVFYKVVEGEWLEELRSMCTRNKEDLDCVKVAEFMKLVKEDSDGVYTSPFGDFRIDEEAGLKPES